MKTLTRGFISFILSVLVVGPVLATTALPAQAAAKSILVDDDRKQCPKADFTDIQSAIDSLGINPTGTITVCAGKYKTTDNGLGINGANNLKLIGKTGAVITPSFAGFATFDAVLLDVQNSSNVTVQGFTFDGQGKLAGNPDVTAIRYGESSGTILKNTIANWHRPGFAPGELMGIYTPSSMGESIKIVGNTFTNFQSQAIHMEGPSAVKITGNTFKAAANVNNDPTAILIIPRLGEGAPHGQITGNRITGNLKGNQASDNMGIHVVEANNLTISANKLDHLQTAIFFENSCVFQNNADDNTVVNNKLTEIVNGIGLQATGNDSGPTPCDAHMDHYRITGNTLVDIHVNGSIGIGLATSNQGAAQGFALDEVVKGNTATRFSLTVTVDDNPAGTITGVFAPNRSINPLPPVS